MKLILYDMDKGRPIGEVRLVTEFSIHGNNQLYLIAKIEDGSTEYMVLMPGWRVAEVPSSGNKDLK